VRARADRARIRGDSAAPVWLVMVSDFQCPYCRMWHDSTYHVLDREYVQTGKVRMAYLNYPLPSHRHAWPAAEASMCAGVQGKFWEMHDLIFDTQAEWTPLASAEAYFDSLATRAGANAAELRKCVRSGTVRALVQADLDRSAASGVSSTPTFIVGDSVIEGAHPAERFRRVLDAALKGGE
jgi:protein-disulfide isomerase